MNNCEAFNFSLVQVLSSAEKKDQIHYHKHDEQTRTVALEGFVKRLFCLRAAGYELDNLQAFIKPSNSAVDDLAHRPLPSPVRGVARISGGIARGESSIHPPLPGGKASIASIAIAHSTSQ